jgi:hypothetical protein
LYEENQNHFFLGRHNGLIFVEKQILIVGYIKTEGGSNSDKLLKMITGKKGGQLAQRLNIKLFFLKEIPQLILC